MRLLFDENVPFVNVETLRKLGIPTEMMHATEVGLGGKPDTEVIPFCRKEGFVLVTEDQNIRRNPHEVAALREAGIGFVEVRVSKNATLLQRHQVYVMGIEKLISAASQDPPFCLILTRDGVREDNIGATIKRNKRRRR